MNWDTRWGGVFSLLDPTGAGNVSIPAVGAALVHYGTSGRSSTGHTCRTTARRDTNFIATTPAGFSYLTSWGAARYNTAAQLEALVYRKNFPTDPDSVLFTNWAMGQMNYLMGDNPAKWSYIVGFGSNAPGVGSQVGGSATAASHPHQGGAQGSLTNNQSVPLTDNHILWGALVGGPSSADQPDDVTTDFVLNEVAVDYNAALVGALAGLYQYYGQGQAMTSFTPPAYAQGNCAEYSGTTCSAPYYATATLNQDSNQSTQITLNINNYADEPPHLQTGMSHCGCTSTSARCTRRGSTSATSPRRCTTTRRARSTARPPPSARRCSGADARAASTTSRSTGATRSACRPRAPSSSLRRRDRTEYKFHWNSGRVAVHDRPPRRHLRRRPGPVHPGLRQRLPRLRTVPATTADEGCGSSGSGGGGTPSVTAEYEASSTAASTSTISNQIELVNNGSSAIPLANLTGAVLVHRGWHRPARLRV